jgi:hypothetical protein
MRRNTRNGEIFISLKCYFSVYFDRTRFDVHDLYLCQLHTLTRVAQTVYDLESAGTVYEKVALWVADKYPLFSGTPQTV